MGCNPPSQPNGCFLRRDEARSINSAMSVRKQATEDRTGQGLNVRSRIRDGERTE